MNAFRFVICSIILFFSFSLPAVAAQSSKDVTASEAFKAEARTKILGKSVSSKPVDQEYLIGHGDYLEVQVYGEGSMAVSAPPPARPGQTSDTLRGGSNGVQVRIDGRISVKHIGDVEAVGMTLTQLADYLKILYSTVYEDPIVTVVLNRSNSKRYTVMGKVNLPGIFYLDYPINLVQVIARCGGFTEWANLEMTVVRKDGAKDSPLFKGNTLKFDYDDFLSGRKLESNILIKSDDIIIVH